MAKLGTISWDGASGTEYDFNVYLWGTSFDAIGAVYVVTKRTLKSDGEGTHTEIYIGETGDLSTRFDTHHKQACFDTHDVNAICIHSEETGRRRLDIEDDLLRNYSPPCND